MILIFSKIFKISIIFSAKSGKVFNENETRDNKIRIWIK